MSSNQHFLNVYKLQTAFLRDTLASLVGTSEVDALEADAFREFEAFLDDIPYADRPDHVMAFPVLACGIVLAFYKAAKVRGYSVHDFGRALHEAPLPEFERSDEESELEQMRREAAESQKSAAPNEFVFEFIDGDGEKLDFGYNIKSCAICHLYAKHDAMDLVPYMCAFDDKMSAARSSGLRRTGTIALGAHHCDFRYKAGGEPLPLAPQYREQVRLKV